MDLLLDHKAIIPVVDRHGNTPIHMAAGRGDSQCLGNILKRLKGPKPGPCPYNYQGTCQTHFCFWPLFKQFHTCDHRERSFSPLCGTVSCSFVASCFRLHTFDPGGARGSLELREDVGDGGLGGLSAGRAERAHASTSRRRGRQRSHCWIFTFRGKAFTFLFL